MAKLSLVDSAVGGDSVKRGCSASVCWWIWWMVKHRLIDLLVLVSRILRSAAVEWWRRSCVWDLKCFKWIRKRRCKVETLGWVPQEGQRVWGWFYDASERSPDGPVAPFYVWVLLPILAINLHEEQNLSHSPSMSITPPTVNIEALKPDKSWELVQAKCCQDVLWKGLVCSVKLGETDVWKIKLLSYILGFFCFFFQAS